MTTTKRKNKYLYLHILQGWYSDLGWEDLCASKSYKEVRDNLRDYQLNERGRYRLIQRRELNPE